MKKIFITKVCIVILMTIQLNANVVKYISTGFGIYSAENTNGGFDFIPIELGWKINNHKIYFSMPHLVFLPKDNDEDDLFLSNYSLSYDYLYYKKNDFSLYFGAGLSLVYLDYTNSTTNKTYSYSKLGSSLKTGFLYDISNSFNLNVGLKYLYINQYLIKDTYGSFINFEYNF